MQNVSFKEINRLAIPAIFAGIAEPLISLSDLAIVGRVALNPSETLAAVGIAGSFLSALIWILAQTKTAISALVSKYLGAGKLSEVKSLVPQTLAFNLSLSLFIYIVTALFAREIFSLYKADGLILDYTVSYYQIRAFGFPLTLATFTLFGVFRGLQNTIWAMYISIAAGLINIGLDILLVYGWEGVIPAMHLEGAAWASLIAQGFMLVAALYFYLSKTPFNLRLRLPFNPELRNLMVMSLNLFVRTAALNFALYLANRYATGYGSDYIAAHTIAMNIWLFSSFFIDGYANAGNAISGRLLGERNYKALWKLGVDLSKYSVVVALILGGVYTAGYTFIGPLFTKDPGVIGLFESVFWLVILMQPIMAVAFTFDGIFKGLGEAKYLRNLLMVATFIGFTPTLMLTDALGWKLHAIWTAFGVWMLYRAGGLLIKFRLKYLGKSEGVTPLQTS